MSLTVGCVEGQPQEKKDQRKGLAFLKRILGAPTGREPLHANVCPLHANQPAALGFVSYKRNSRCAPVPWPMKARGLSG